jgi:NDP-sugar pyrophosphorylase family protein
MYSWDAVWVTSRESALIMKAMLLCAGSATRLRPFTSDTPKCMIPLGGKPLLAYTIEWLRSNEIRDLVINLSYFPEQVTGYFGDGSAWGVHIRYSIEDVALGTAGGVRNAGHLLGGGEPFLVWYGDNLSHCSIRSLVQAHRERKGTTTIAVFERDDPRAGGIVEFDASRKIRRFIEKPSDDEVFSSWVNAGIMLCEQTVLDLIPEGIADFGHNILPQLLRGSDGLYAYPLSSAESLFWIDTPRDLARVQSLFAGGSWPTVCESIADTCRQRQTE